tara:strand:- start:660 stop:782 length:123 start_codon:yes stop_codon:yes gene_type:complete
VVVLEVALEVALKAAKKRRAVLKKPPATVYGMYIGTKSKM